MNKEAKKTIEISLITCVCLIMFISSKPEIGLMLPCNVTVEAVDDGCIVRIVNPIAMLQMGDLGADEAIAKIASDAAERLHRVADMLSS